MEGKPQIRLAIFPPLITLLYLVSILLITRPTIEFTNHRFALHIDMRMARHPSYDMTWEGR